MNSTQREQLLTMILPGFLVAFGWWGYMRPTKAYQSAQRELQAARAAVVAPEMISVEQQKLGKLNTELAEQKTQLNDLVARWESLRKGHVSVNSRAQTMEDLTRIFTNHGLVMIRDNASGDGAGNRAIPESLTKAFDRLAMTALEVTPDLKKLGSAAGSATVVAKTGATLPQPAPDAEGEGPVRRETTPMQLWKMEFVGSFSDVREALTELHNSGSRAIPIGLSMNKVKLTTTNYRSLLRESPEDDQANNVAQPTPTSNNTLRRWTFIVRI